MLDERKEKRITIRLSADDYEMLSYVSFVAGMTNAKYVRTLIKATVAAVRVQRAKGVITDADIKAVLDSELQHR